MVLLNLLVLTRGAMTFDEDVYSQLLNKRIEYLNVDVNSKS